MDLLMAEIARKRKSVERAKTSSRVRKIGSHSCQNSEGPNDRRDSREKKRKFFRASDLRRFEEEEELEREQEQELRRSFEHTSMKLNASKLQIESSEEIDVKQKHDDSNPTKAQIKTKEQSSKSSSAEDGVSNEANPPQSSESESTKALTSNLTPDEITEKLRAIGQPIRLFGEKTKILPSSSSNKHKFDDSQRESRLLDAQNSLKKALSGKSDMDDFRLGRGHGIRNPFLENKNNAGSEIDTSSSTVQNSIDPNGNSNLSSTLNKLNDPNTKKTKGNEEEEEETAQDPHKHIHKFFKTQLKLWETDLLHRPEHIKRTAIGKNETKTLKQCKDYIRPLFKLCKSRRLEPFLLNQIYKIVLHCQEGEFVLANNVYNDVAIGRAAWPIGVTMVGIHARSGRAKIESGNVAHVMNSELQRKYLTSVKRLMTYCQKKRKDVAPSKKVMN